MIRFVRALVIALVAAPAVLRAQATSLPAIERIVDSTRALGLPVEPLYAKVAEGRLKQASDAQIVAAVRALAGRFRTIRSALGPNVDATILTAAATALSAGIPIETIRDLRDAAAGSRDASADLAGALITATDLVAQHVSPERAAGAVQPLLARRATPEQFARLRSTIGESIAGGRSPDQAARSASEAIVKSLPAAPPAIPVVKPPVLSDAIADTRVPLAPSTSRNSR